ncbi:unnamed protein product [Alternaria alternata]
MTTTLQPRTSETTPLYLSIRLTTHAKQKPTIGTCDIAYADEPLERMPDDYVQPKLQHNRYGNVIPQHSWVYTSAVFTSAPYTRSMKITMRCYDDKVSDTRLSIIAVDEYKHVSEGAMREDIARYVDAVVQTPAGQQAQIRQVMTSTSYDIDLQDPVTGQNNWWSLLQWSACNTRAYLVGRRIPEQNMERMREIREDWERETDSEAFGCVEEGKKDWLELHAVLDLVEVNTDVEEETIKFETEGDSKMIGMSAEHMIWLRERHDHELDAIYYRLLEEGTKSSSGNKLHLTP